MTQRPAELLNRCRSRVLPVDLRSVYNRRQRDRPGLE